MKKRILVIAAHPDDEVLGCGGTVAKLVKEEKYEAYCLVPGEGIAGRKDEKDISAKQKELLEQQKAASTILGMKSIEISTNKLFPDQKLDTVPFIDVTQFLEGYLKEIKPDIIFTHHAHDCNLDHRIIHEAVLVATRPFPGQFVKKIYAFETLSSTEWSFPVHFSPNEFFDISTTIDQKKKAMEIYKGEIRSFPHPRSLKGIEVLAQYRGMNAGMPYAEAFEVVRSLQ